MEDTIRVVTIKGLQYEVREDEEKIYFKEISDRKNKAHFTLSKDPEHHKEAEFGLRTFWTEVFS